MKISQPCGIAASKGNQIIRLIRRNIVYKEKTNNTAVQNTSYVSFRISYTSMEAILQEGH